MPVVVNKTLITDVEINEESAYVDAEGITARHEEAARRLVIRELLRLRAKDHGFDVQNDLDGAVEEVLNHEVTIPEVNEAACRQYYQSNVERFVTPVTMEIRHILLKAAPDDPEERAQAEEKAAELIADLKCNPTYFADYASRFSACSSSSAGGHMGAIGRGQTVPEFESVVLRLEPGLAERPVETRYGFHVVEILTREGGEPLPFDSVRHLIADYLHENSWRRAVHQFIQVLIDEAEIKGIEFSQNESPLLQ